MSEIIEHSLSAGFVIYRVQGKRPQFFSENGYRWMPTAIKATHYPSKSEANRMAKCLKDKEGLKVRRLLVEAE